MEMKLNFKKIKLCGISMQRILKLAVVEVKKKSSSFSFPINFRLREKN